MSELMTAINKEISSLEEQLETLRKVQGMFGEIEKPKREPARRARRKTTARRKTRAASKPRTAGDPTAKALAAFGKNGSKKELTAGELGTRLKVSASSARGLMSKLVRDGQIVEVGLKSSGTGKPARTYAKA